jgi:hypothetical protein
LDPLGPKNMMVLKEKGRIIVTNDKNKNVD